MIHILLKSTPPLSLSVSRPPHLFSLSVSSAHSKHVMKRKDINLVIQDKKSRNILISLNHPTFPSTLQQLPIPSCPCNRQEKKITKCKSVTNTHFPSFVTLRRGRKCLYVGGPNTWFIFQHISWFPILYKNHEISKSSYTHYNPPTTHIMREGKFGEILGYSQCSGSGWVLLFMIYFMISPLVF